MLSGRVESVLYLLAIIILNNQKGIYIRVFCDRHQLITLV
ncbi:hypothetical protein ATN83_0980 [Raoultella ornithinolytica]|nr:hypothetical protein ATN83_0980 [Raoultella ornithinolytica]KDV92176.1 hypothetical protein AB00_3884 [Raoultella ornithinolytica 2-156-04_S1_C1]KDX12648.1 hypothetical protein AB28_3889 [Raoultella ornithinolytica 2-156-04_S1_C2]